MTWGAEKLSVGKLDVADVERRYSAEKKITIIEVLGSAWQQRVKF